MKRKVRIFLIATVLLSTASAFGWDVIAHDLFYYPDGTFTTAVGEWETTCDGQLITWGNTSTSFRTYTTIHCLYGTERMNCQQLNGSGGWTIIPCPN